jgi:hypothetical protein
LPALFKEKNKLLIASFKTLTNSKDCFESRIKFLFRLFFPFIGRFSPMHIHGCLTEKFSGSQVASGTTFIVTGGYLKAKASFLRGLLERFSQLENGFRSAIETIFWIFFTKRQLKCRNHQQCSTH